MQDIYRVIAQWPGKEGSLWRQVKAWDTVAHVWCYPIQRYIGSGCWL